MKLKIEKNKKGSALILTMFILSGMFLIAIGSSYLVILGIKAGGIQAQSTKAYYVSESGAERFLWELRQGGYRYLEDNNNPVFIHESSDDKLILGGDYEVFNEGGRLYRSVGEFNGTKRSVEVEF